MQPTAERAVHTGSVQKTVWLLLASIVVYILEAAHSISLVFCNWLYKGKSLTIPAATDPLLFQPAIELAAKIRSRKVTSEQVVTAYIDRIRQVNPIVNAVVDDRFQDALAEAREVDEQITAGRLTQQQMEEEKPFWGVPLTVKDSCAVKGLRQTVGLVVRKDAVASQDSEVVRRMREAGAIVVGVTNLPELSSSFDTCNRVYGQTRNPYDTARSPGGSSGGEGSIIASAGSVMGVGTDLAGSIRLPAMLNGIFGHKPTELSISSEGTVPALQGEMLRYFTTGPLSRYATDLKPMLNAMTCSSIIKEKLKQPVDVKRLRVFYITDEPGTKVGSRPVSDDIWKAQEKVVEYLRKAHGIEAQKIDFPEISKAMGVLSAVMRQCRPYPFTEEMADRKASPNIWWELLKTFSWSSPHTFCMMAFAIGEKLGSSSLLRVYPRMYALKQRIENKFEELLADDGVLIFPLFPTCAYYSSMNIFYQMSFAYSGLVNVLGVPATQFPVGLNKDGLPVGLQVIGWKNNDHLCLAFAEEMEKAFGGWVDPATRSSNVH